MPRLIDPMPQPNRNYDSRALAHLLSFRSTTTLERWLQEGKLPQPDVRIGRKRLWYYTSLKKFFAAQGVDFDAMTGVGG